MRSLTFRLRRGDLLKEEIERRTKESGVRAGVLLSIVGGLSFARLRMPQGEDGQHEIKELVGPFELVSGTGTVSQDGCHIHVSMSDRSGACHGGHLKDGCVVVFTAEVVIGIFDDAAYRRTFDEKTGFEELEVVQDPLGA